MLPQERKRYGEREEREDGGEHAVDAERLYERYLYIEERDGRDGRCRGQGRDDDVVRLVRGTHEREKRDEEEKAVERDAHIRERYAEDLRIRALRDRVAAVESCAYVADQGRAGRRVYREIDGIGDADGREGHEEPDEERAIHASK